MKADIAFAEQAAASRLSSAISTPSFARRILGATLGLSVAASVLVGNASAADVRTLDLYNAHTKERLTITYKRDGRYIPAALKQLNHFLRDWRRNEEIRMDPRLFDAVWEVYRKTGANQPIHVVCGYRSLATNNMLRSRSSAVAENSQHTLGRAMDLFVPGVSVNTVRAIGVKLQNGGVGWYPNANSPFVHIDVGNVRAWPRMSRTQLVQLFPDGKTAHIPSDGKPLPGYQTALAEIKAKRGDTSTLMASADRPSRGGGFLAALFGSGEDDSTEMEAATEAAPAKPTLVAAAPAKPAPVAAAPTAVASAAPATKPAPAAQPAPVLVAAFAPRPTPAPERPQPVTSLADATLPSDLAEAKVAEVPTAETLIPLPISRPDEIAADEPVVLASLDVPPVLPPDKPEPPMELAATEAPLPPVNLRNDAIAAQMALAEVADHAQQPAVESPVASALSYAPPAAAAEPEPVQMAALAATPPSAVRALTPATTGALKAGRVPLPPTGNKGDRLNTASALSAASIAQADDPSPMDGSQSVYWGRFGTLTHPDQRDLRPLFEAPVLAAASFTAKPYGTMVSTRFAGEVPEPNDIVEFLPQNQLAMR